MLKLDALILAGDKDGYIPVSNENKAFITINQKRSIEFVIEELDKSLLVKDIYVIGPRNELLSLKSLHCGKKITILEQRNSIIENVLFAYSQIYPNEGNLPILILPADIPLVSSTEIDYFIANSNFIDYDYVMGFVKESALTHFYPSKSKRGIRLSYYYFKQYVVRINNLHIANPNASSNYEYADKIYALRYQKKIMNYLRFLMEIFKSNVNKKSFLKFSFIMQISLQFDRFGFYKLARLVGRYVDVSDFEQCIADALRIRFKIFCLDFGGSALDIDNENDLMAIKYYYADWRKYLKEQVMPLTD